MLKPVNLPRSSSANRRQRGFTIVEILVVLIVSVSAMALGGSALNDYLNGLEYQSAAGHAKKVQDAARSYIKANSAVLQAAATATTPADITVAMLKSTTNLSSSVSDQNGYGQSYTIRVLQPTAGTLNALVVTTGGSAIPEIGLRRIAQVIGAEGGFVSNLASTTATGALGGWSIPLATAPGSNFGVSPGAGHLAVSMFLINEGASDYVYRNSVTGRPDLNTMNTPLIMASVQTKGAACTAAQLGSIARDSTGALLTCTTGLVWSAVGGGYWSDPVANLASLPACAAASVGVTRIVQTPTTGVGPRAYTCDGAAWKALSVDDTGNLLVPAVLTVGKVTLSDTVVAGAACTINGQIAKDATGLILSCQSGVWRRQGYWVDVPLSDTNPFEPDCEYRWSYGAVEYPDYVSSGSLFAYYLNGTYWTVAYLNKAVMQGTGVSSYAVLWMQMRC